MSDSPNSEWYYIKNWWKFQHYKDRNPPWIKLHKSFQTDPDFQKLEEVEQWRLVKLWVVASDIEGRLPIDAAYIKERLGLYHLQSAVNLLANLEDKKLIAKVDIRGDRRTRASTKQRQKHINKKQNPPSIPQNGVFAFEGPHLKITEELHKTYEATYPGIDFFSEYRKMDAWIASNVPRGIKQFGRFANSWLSKIPENGARRYVNKAEQRELDNKRACEEALRRAAERDRQADSSAGGSDGGEFNLEPN